ncbi:MAG: EAL domain-containing protein [Thermodesulfovibrionales bacterium]
MDVSSGKIAWTEEVYRIYGVPKDFETGNIPAAMSFYHPDSLPLLEEAFAKALEQGEPYDLELKFINAQGEHLWVRTVGNPIRDNGRAVRISGNIMDITEQKRMEEEIRHLAHHDSLTGLPNRLLFMDILRKELAHAHRSRKKLAVFFLDLDRFKYINDTLGHDVGDRLLKKVASRLRASVRESDTVSRTGGDEFNILLTDLTHAGDIVTVARNILHAFLVPCWINGHELHVAISMGISIYPDDAQDSETLLKNADIALYHTKGHGGNNYQFYDASMNIHTLERVRLEHHLRQSLTREELMVYYQPQFSTDTRRVVCAEALVRWEHPELGILDPIRFIPLAEETGFIISIDEWVLREACAQFRQWQQEGYPDLCVTVNLSAKQFKKSDLAEKIAQILKETGLAPRHLNLEITESIAMEDLEHTIPLLRRLVGMGIGISIDDFGTGYSSLSYLKRLPVNKLKIDQSFVRDIATDPDDRSIIKAITALAQSMRLGVIAEGVETEEQLEFLRAAGCREAQGYLFSRPLPPGEFKALVADGK